MFGRIIPAFVNLTPEIMERQLMRHLITHGTRWTGGDPRTRQEGLARIVQIRTDLLPLIPRPAQVLVGTGHRFIETWDRIAPLFPNITVGFTPLLGGPEASEKDELHVSLADGRKIPRDSYIGINTPSFNAWLFVANVQDTTLFCSGPEFMEALGLLVPGHLALGRLFALDADKHLCTEIT